jgi:hypothetical protein
VAAASVEAEVAAEVVAAVAVVAAAVEGGSDDERENDHENDTIEFKDLETFMRGSCDFICRVTSLCFCVRDECAECGRFITEAQDVCDSRRSG